MNDRKTITNELPIKVGLIPTEIKAKNSLEELIENVRKFQKEHNATDEMLIVATVVFTVRS